MQNREQLSEQISYVTLNPSSQIMESVQIGFDEVGLHPKFLIIVNPVALLKSEYDKYRLGILERYLLPRMRTMFSSKKSDKGSSRQFKVEVIKKVRMLNSDDTMQFIIDNKIKYLVNCGAGIFRKKLLSIPNLQILNAHAGKLPEYRNMNNVEWALLNKDKLIGTIHFVDSGIDTGEILFEEEIPPKKFLSIEDYREYAFDYVFRLYGKALILYHEGLIKSRPQEMQGKVYYRMHGYFKDKLLENSKSI